MHPAYLRKKKLILAITAIPASTIVMAQDAPATAAKATVQGQNQLAILLVVSMVVLALVIFILGQILLAIGKQAVAKSKQTTAVVTGILVMLFLLSSQSSFAQDAATAEPAEVVSNYGGISSTTFYLFVIVLVIEVIAILFLIFLIRRLYVELVPQKEAAAAKTSRLAEWWAGLDKKIFTKAIPVDREADIILVHDSDGIKELDNALPPWWKYGFLVTIVVAVIYLLNFHVFAYGKNPTQEYAAEIEKANAEKELYESKNKDKIDEKNVPMADAAGIAKAKDIFGTKCLACHGKLGEGGVGPNLTDDYWLHKGSLNDIYHSIKVGYPEKGMQSWANDYTPKEISFLASYVKTLKGTNPPNPKAPQGDLYTEDAAKVTGVDSASAKKEVPTKGKDSVSSSPVVK